MSGLPPRCAGYSDSQRGDIKGFSNRSRARLIETIQSVPDSLNCKMITLTYATENIEESKSKKDLDIFFKRLRRHIDNDATFFVWKKEYQKRGTIHFHILCYSMPYVNKDWLAKSWNEVTGEGPSHLAAGTKIEKIRNPRYIFKYVAKPLIAQAKQDSRYWGVVNRKSYKEAAGKREVDITLEEYNKIKRIIRKHAVKMRKIKGQKPTGFEPLYTRTMLNVERLVRLVKGGEMDMKKEEITALESVKNVDTEKVFEFESPEFKVRFIIRPKEKEPVTAQPAPASSHST